MAQILLVEDAPDNRNIAELILLDAGHTVICVGDGVSAITTAADLQPDVILMDLSIPRIDGWEATRLLKMDPLTSEIPVIAFTAHALPNDIERAHAAGCAAVIAKPFEIDFFLGQVNAMLRPEANERSRAHGERA